MSRRISIVVLILLAVLAAVVSFMASYQVGDRIFPLPFVRVGPSEDLWFDADTRVVVSNMTDHTVMHWTLYKHPLFSIIFWPLTQAVAAIVGNELLAVHVIYAANASLTVLLLWWLLARVGVLATDRTLLSLLFIVSGTMFFWYSVPESFPFGTNTLLIGLHAAISGRPRTLIGYIGQGLANLATLSMTVTNWVAGIIASATAFGLLDRPFNTMSGLRQGKFTSWPSIRGVAMITVGAFLVAAVLSVIQNQFFGEAALFFNPRHLMREAEFLLDFRFSNPLLRPLVMIFSPIVVGTVETWAEGTRLMADNAIPSTWTGLVALGLWIALLAGGIWAVVQQLRNTANLELPTRRLAIAASVSLAFMVALHSVFGYLVFLYVPHTLPYVLSIVALVFLGQMRSLARVLISLLIVFALIHNFDAFQFSVAFVDTILPRQ